MNCPHCNHPLGETQNLCWYCGTYVPLFAPARSVQQQYQQPNVPTVQNLGQQQQVFGSWQLPAIAPQAGLAPFDFAILGAGGSTAMQPQNPVQAGTKCPSCRAPISPEMKFCHVCGTSLAELSPIKELSMASYTDVSQNGQQQSQAEKQNNKPLAAYAGNDLMSLLVSAKEEMLEIEKISIPLSRVELEIESLRTLPKGWFRGAYIVLEIVVWLVAYFAISMLFILILDSPGVGVLLGLVLAPVAVFVVYQLFKKKKLEKNRLRTQHLEQQRVQLQQSYEEIFGRVAHAIRIIPSDYRDSDILNEMNRYLQAGRASNWRECANLFEEEMHRMEMQRSQQESLQMQADIMYETRRAANAAQVAAINSFYNR